MATLIQNSEKEAERQHANTMSNKKYILGTLGIVLFFIIVLIYLLIDKNSSLLWNIIVALFSLVSGAFGRYGVGYTKAKNEIE